jgi:hypothetical protein
VRGGRLKQSGHGHCEALAKQDGELRLGRGPFARGHNPLHLGAVQDEEEECLLAGGEPAPGDSTRRRHADATVVCRVRARFGRMAVSTEQRSGA